MYLFRSICQYFPVLSLSKFLKYRFFDFTKSTTGYKIKKTATKKKQMQKQQNIMKKSKNGKNLIFLRSFGMKFVLDHCCRLLLDCTNVVFVIMEMVTK